MINFFFKNQIWCLVLILGTICSVNSYPSSSNNDLRSKRQTQSNQTGGAQVEPKPEPEKIATEPKPEPEKTAAEPEPEPEKTQGNDAGITKTKRQTAQQTKDMNSTSEAKAEPEPEPKIVATPPTSDVEKVKPETKATENKIDCGTDKVMDELKSTCKVINLLITSYKI